MGDLVDRLLGLGSEDRSSDDRSVKLADMDVAGLRDATDRLLLGTACKASNWTAMKLEKKERVRSREILVSPTVYRTLKQASIASRG